MVTGEMVKGKRLDSLQGIRAIAFLAIFLFHSGAAVFALSYQLSFQILKPT